MACPLCIHTSSRLFKKDGYWIYKCSNCNHRFSVVETPEDHVQEVYDLKYFQGDGAGYPNYLNESKTHISRGRWYAQLLAQYTEPGIILDVGAAAGFILKGFVDSGWDGSGIEPNASLADYARTRLSLDVKNNTLENYQSDKTFDLINMIQVVAHFIDPRRALESAAEITRGGGFWLIETWNRNSLIARLFGQQWHEYSPPSVLHWFSKTSLSDFVASFGFEEVASGRPQKRIHPSHASNLIEYKFGHAAPGKIITKLMGRIPDSLAIPYPGDDVFWTLYQKK